MRHSHYSTSISIAPYILIHYMVGGYHTNHQYRMCLILRFVLNKTSIPIFRTSVSNSPVIAILYLLLLQTSGTWYRYIPICNTTNTYSHDTIFILIVMSKISNNPPPYNPFKFILCIMNFKYCYIITSKLISSYLKQHFYYDQHSDQVLRTRERYST